MTALIRCDACGVLRGITCMNIGGVENLILCLRNQHHLSNKREKISSSMPTGANKQTDVIVCDVCTWCNVPSVCIEHTPGIRLCVLCLEITQTNNL